MQSNIFLLTGEGIEYGRLQQQELDGFIQIGDGENLIKNSDLERLPYQSDVGIVYAHGSLGKCSRLPKSKIACISLIADVLATADNLTLLQIKLNIKHFYLFSCRAGVVPYHWIRHKNELKENTTITIFANSESSLCSYNEGMIRKIQLFYAEHQGNPSKEIERDFYYENVLFSAFPSVRCEISEDNGQKKFNAFKVKTPKSQQDINDIESYFTKRNRLKPIIIEDDFQFQNWIEKGTQKKLNFNLDEYKNIALIDSVSRNKFERACEWIKMGAKVNLDPTSSIVDQSALSIACWGGYYPLAKMLIKENADVNHERDDGCTPLCLAASGGYEKVVELLINAGANVNHQFNDGTTAGITALQLASERGQNSIVQKLIDSGANIHHKNQIGKTALHAAARMGHLEVAKKLILLGADIYSTMNNGITSLHIACYLGYKDIVMYLLDRYSLKGKTIDAIDHNGETPLQLAVVKGHYKIVRKLIEAGADVNHCNNNGNDALLLANIYHNYKIAEFIRDL